MHPTEVAASQSSSNANTENMEDRYEYQIETHPRSTPGKSDAVTLCFPCSHAPRTLSVTNVKYKNMSRTCISRENTFHVCSSQEKFAQHFFALPCPHVHVRFPSKLPIHMLASSMISTKKHNNVHVPCLLKQDMHTHRTYRVFLWNRSVGFRKGPILRNARSYPEKQRSYPEKHCFTE